MGQRKILFKAKRLDNSEWVEGDLVHYNGNKVGIQYYNDIGDGIYVQIIHQVDPSTVCQFTGLKDKDGKEVWEGDYLKVKYDGYKPIKVIFKNGSFGLDIPYNGSELAPLACCDLLVEELEKLEIVDRKEEK